MANQVLITGIDELFVGALHSRVRTLYYPLQIQRLLLLEVEKLQYNNNGLMNQTNTDVVRRETRAWLSCKQQASYESICISGPSN
jgi:hypothetical protein